MAWLSGFKIVLCVAAGLGLGVSGFIYLKIVPKPNLDMTPVNYRDEANWACRPGRLDECASDLQTTAISTDGSLKLLTAPAANDPAIDCFYVYPTVSRDRTANAGMELSDQVAEAIRVQFASFRGVCRMYAPLYRQVTLKSLAASALGLGKHGDFGLAYGDVRDAWRDYMAHDNQGRGVVLIGHSQGSRMLKLLIQREIEQKPVQSQLVSAILAGNALIVPAGKDVGGDFKTVRVCRESGQVGCVMAWSSFRASAPPVGPYVNGLGHYGIDPGNGWELACTNAASLGGGRAPIDSVFPTRLALRGKDWVDPPVKIVTPFVTTPGMIFGECVHENGKSYFAVTFHGEPGDKRRADVNGDVVVFGKHLGNWGLHLLDVNLQLGDLVKEVGVQTTAYLATHPTVKS